MTSNPAIFEKRRLQRATIRRDIRAMALEGKAPRKSHEVLSRRDLQGAADEFRPLYDKTDGQDGYVSLEVIPIWRTIRRARYRRPAGCGATLNRRMSLSRSADAEGCLHPETH